MPEADRLEVLDADDVADRARASSSRLSEPRVRRVAEHVRDGGDDARALRAPSAIRTHSSSVAASGFSISSA